jgi:hypothetical protein
MTDRPIIFSGPMVRALLDGRKTQTRRILKPPAGCRIENLAETDPHMFSGRTDDPKSWGDSFADDGGPLSLIDFAELRYRPGDRLWVRENFKPVHGGDPSRGARYRTDASTDQTIWKPSIHMPRWASRLTLIVTGVKVERVQSISNKDAQAEGIVEDDGSEPDIWYVPGSGGTDLGRKMNPLMADKPSKVFASLWCALHGDDAWKANPWVVALTFTVHKHNIDAMRASAPPVEPRKSESPEAARS